MKFAFAFLKHGHFARCVEAYGLKYALECLWTVAKNKAYGWAHWDYESARLVVSMPGPALDDKDYLKLLYGI